MDKKMHQKKFKKNRKHHRRTWFEKSFLKNETKPLISASSNGCIRINYVKAKANKTGKSNKSLFCEEIHETVKAYHEYNNKLVRRLT